MTIDMRACLCLLSCCLVLSLFVLIGPGQIRQLRVDIGGRSTPKQEASEHHQKGANQTHLNTFLCSLNTHGSDSVHDCLHVRALNLILWD